MKIRDRNDVTTWEDKERARQTYAFTCLAAFGLLPFGFIFALWLLHIPNMVGKDSRAKVAKAHADLAILRGEIDQFRLDCKRYPTQLEGFHALVSKPKELPGWNGPYLQKEVTDDPWGNPYVYKTPGKNGQTGYLIESFGADGQPDGDGDNEDITDGSD